MLKMIDLFAGIGGISLAAEMTGEIEAVCFCEKAEYPQKILKKHWPDVPIIPDIKNVTRQKLTEVGVIKFGESETAGGPIDIICGGFPCQPFSVAGKRRGEEDDRYLWPAMLRVIAEVKPAWVVGENVAGIVNMALDQVLFDLESQGYETQAFIIPACGVDAPHRRNRVFIVANRNCVRGNAWRPKSAGQQWEARVANGGKDVADTECCGFSWDERREATQQPENIGQNVADAKSQQGGGLFQRGLQTDIGDGCNRGAKTGWWSIESNLGGMADGISGGLDGIITWPPEPDIPRVADGVPNRVNRLKCLGNAVVPAQIYPILAAIAQIEHMS